MANLIDEIVSQKAFDELERLKRELAEAQKSIEAFYKQTGSMPKFGGSGTATSELEKMVALTKRLTEQIRVYGSVSGKALVEAQQAKRELVNETKLLVQQEENEEGSLNRLRAELNLLERQYAKLGPAAREANSHILTGITKTHTEITKLEQSMGNYKRNVGNYTNATFQLSQVFRELPAFTFSATTGIMALGNNFPMLIDAFKQVSQATDITTGKINGTMGALKIFGASILSFGNIATLAIAAFTIFNKEIMAFFKGADEFSVKMDDIRESVNGATEDMGRLRLAMQQAKDGLISKEEALKVYNETLGKATQETKDFNEAEKITEQQGDAYIQMTIMKARAAKMLANAIKLATDAAEMQDDWWTTLKAQVSEGWKAFGSTGNPLLFFNRNPQDAYEAYRNQAQAEADAAEKAWIEEENRLAQFMKEHGFNSIDEKNEKEKTKRKNKAQINRIEELKKEYEQEKNLAEANFNLGRTSFMQYQKELMRIQEEYFRVRLSGISNLTKDEKDKQISFLNDLAKDAKEIINSMEEWVNKAKNAVDAARKADMERMAKEGKDEFAKTAEESVKWFKSWLEKQPPAKIKVSIQPEPIDPEDLVKLVIDSVNKASELMKSISDATFNAEMSRFNEREKRMTDYYDEEEKRVKQSYTNKDEQEKQLTKLNARRAAEEKALEKDRALSARKRANAQKAYDIANIITTTASAIMETLETYKGTPLAYIMAGVVAATGAAQIAAAQSAPIPQFAKGTENSPEGYAVVGEKGHELVIEPSGKKWVTPAKDTITYLRKGSKVIPNDKLMTMVRDSAYVELANMNMPVTPDLYGKALIDQFERLSDDVKDLKAVMSNKDMRVNIVGNFDHYMHVKRNIK